MFRSRERRRRSPDKSQDKEGDLVYTASYLSESDVRAAKLILGLYTFAFLLAGIVAIGVAVAIAGQAISVPPSGRWWIASAALVFGLVLLGVVALLRAIRNSARVQEAVINYSILAFFL